MLVFIILNYLQYNRLKYGYSKKDIRVINEINFDYTNMKKTTITEILVILKLTQNSKV